MSDVPGPPSAADPETDADDTQPLARVRTATVRPPEDERRCPSCGAGNLAQRELCVVCGNDLETGLELPVAVAAPPASAPEERMARGRAGTALVVLVVAALAVAGGVLLGLAIAQVGPFAPAPPSLPDVAFDPGAYGPDGQELELTGIATLTTHDAEDGREFTAASMADHDPATSWRSDAVAAATQAPGGNGDEAVHEAIGLYLARPSWVHQIAIRNGDHLDAAAYAAVGRVRQARITLDGDVAYLMHLLDQGREVQAVELPHPVLTTTVRIEVLETFPGENGDDVAISELSLWGWPASAQDAELAAERAEVARAAGEASDVQPS